jgi:hypothetical protein
MRRIDDDIRSLCHQLLAAKNDRECRRLVIQLRTALQTKVKRLRIHAAQYPMVLERRKGRADPPDGTTGALRHTTLSCGSPDLPHPLFRQVSPDRGVQGLDIELLLQPYC